MKTAHITFHITFLLASVMATVAVLILWGKEPEVLNLFTGLGAFATVVYCIYTIQIVRATQTSVDLLRQQYEEDSRARITITPYVRDSKFMLRLANVGKHEATDLKINLPAQVMLIDGQRALNDAPMVKRGIKALQAGVEISFTLGIGHQVMQRSEEELAFNVEVEYGTGIRNQLRKDIFQIDLNPWWMADASRSDMERCLMDAKNALESIAHSLKR